MLYVLEVGTARLQAEKEYNFARETEVFKVSVAFDKKQFLFHARDRFRNDFATSNVSPRATQFTAILLVKPVFKSTCAAVSVFALSLQRHRFFSLFLLFKFVTSITKESIFARTNKLLVGTLIPKGDDVLQKSGKLTVFIASIIFIVVQCPCKKCTYRHTL